MLTGPSLARARALAAVLTALSTPPRMKTPSLVFTALAALEWAYTLVPGRSTMYLSLRRAALPLPVSSSLPLPLTSSLPSVKRAAFWSSPAMVSV